MCVTILVMLAGASLPVFSRVRERGRSTTCLSNLKQLTIALQQYTDDASGQYLLWWTRVADVSHTTISDYKHGISWTSRLLPYAKQSELFHCPSRANDSRPFVDALGLGHKAMYPDYSFNANLTALPESKISITSNVVTFHDGAYSPFEYYSSTPPGESKGGDRHSGGANYAFVDGHVKWFGLKDQVRMNRGGALDSTVDPLCSPQQDLTFCPF